MTPPPVRVAALYRFATFDDCAALREPLQAACEQAGVRGTLLLAPEGINGTIAGTERGVEDVLNHLRALPGCADLDVKEAAADVVPFHRMKVRLKREIVTLGEAGVDPVRDAGLYVEPQDWNALLAEPGVVVIDTRNAYEVKVGSFAGAVDPGTVSFGEFPAWFRANRNALLGQSAPKVAMFCTGGIRCEKATAFLKAEGVEKVHHLKGGILRYLETVAPEDSLWQGECFVFDQRVAVGQGLAPGTHGLCHACRMPVSVEDQASPLFEAGVQCPACAGAREVEQRARYAERQRQMEIAGARGRDHIGVRPPAKAFD
jgi:UPF0176 protein